MATLPDPSQIKRETPTPAIGVASYRTGMVEGAQAQFGADIAKMAEIESVRIDKSVVEQAVTELRQKSFELAAGDDGYAKKQGSQVVHQPQGGKAFIVDYKDRFKSTADDITSRLSSPRQREEFAQHVAREGLSFQSSLMAHSMKETERFHAQAKEGRINLEMQIGAQNWQDPAKSAESLAEINRVYDNMIVVDGQSADAVNAVRAVNVSKFHQSIISEAAANENPEFAKSYLDQHRDQILGVEKIEAEIEKVGNEKLAAQTGVQVFQELNPTGNETGDIPTMAAEIRARLDGKPQSVVDRAIAQMKDEVQMRRDALNQREAAPYRMVLDGKSVSQIKQTSEFRALDTDGQNKIIKAARDEERRRAGESGSPKADGYVQLAKTHALLSNPDKLAKMSPSEVIIYARDNNLGANTASHLLNAREKMNTPQGVAEAKVNTMELKGAYIAAGKPVPKESDPEYVQSYLYTVGKATQMQQQLGRELTPAERKDLYARSMREVPIERNYWFDSKVPMYKATPDQVAKAIATMPVDKATYAKVKADLQRVSGRVPADIEVRTFMWQTSNPN